MKKKSNVELIKTKFGIKRNIPESFFGLIFSSILLILFFFLSIVFTLLKKYIQNKKKAYLKNKRLIQRTKGLSDTKRYDVQGNYTEDYQRIRLINFFLNKGFQKSQLFMEYSIFFGHKGKNCMRADLVIKNKNHTKIIAVIEVKKKYTESTKLSAVQHQLIPAMKLLDCNVGIYYDGSKNSSCFLKENNGVITEKKIKYLNQITGSLLSQSV